MKIVNSLYTMVSIRFNFKTNKRFDSLSWSSVVKDLYTRRGYIIGEKIRNRSRLGKRKRRRGRLHFSLRGFSTSFGY